MSDMYGGVEKSQVAKYFLAMAIFIGFIILVIYLVKPELIGLAPKSKMSNPFNPNAPATLQQLNGTSGQRWRQSSNLGSDAMSNHHHTDHLVGTFDRPVSWIGGTSNGLPANWDAEKSASAMGSVVLPAPAVAGSAMPTKTSMSNNSVSKIDVEKQLNSALNTM